MLSPHMSPPPPPSGHSVCRESWLRMLGLGKNRLRRTKKRHRGEDERTWKTGRLSMFLFSNFFLEGSFVRS